jgi:hypothetical protein
LGWVDVNPETETAEADDMVQILTGNNCKGQVLAQAQVRGSINIAYEDSTFFQSTCYADIKDAGYDVKVPVTGAQEAFAECFSIDGTDVTALLGPNVNCWQLWGGACTDAAECGKHTTTSGGMSITQAGKCINSICNRPRPAALTVIRVEYQFEAHYQDEKYKAFWTQVNSKLVGDCQRAGFTASVAPVGTNGGIVAEYFQTSGGCSTISIQSMIDEVSTAFNQSSTAKVIKSTVSVYNFGGSSANIEACYNGVSDGLDCNTSTSCAIKCADKTSCSADKNNCGGDCIGGLCDTEFEAQGEEPGDETGATAALSAVAAVALAGMVSMFF